MAVRSGRVTPLCDGIGVFFDKKQIETQENKKAPFMGAKLTDDSVA